MESIKFSYSFTEKILADGVSLSGLFKPAKARQTTLTALMAVVIANAVYGTISLKELTLRNGFYLIASAVIILLLWLEPGLRIKSYKKNNSGKEAEIEVKRDKITAKIGEDTLNIIGEGLKDYREEDEYIVIYFASEFLLLPKAQKTQEEINTVLDFLENFHLIGKEVQ